MSVSVKRPLRLGCSSRQPPAANTCSSSCLQLTKFKETYHQQLLLTMPQPASSPANLAAAAQHYKNTSLRGCAMQPKRGAHVHASQHHGPTAALQTQQPATPKSTGRPPPTRWRVSRSKWPPVQRETVVEYNLYIGTKAEQQRLAEQQSSAAHTHSTANAPTAVDTHAHTEGDGDTPSRLRRYVAVFGASLRPPPPASQKPSTHTTQHPSNVQGSQTPHQTPTDTMAPLTALLSNLTVAMRCRRPAGQVQGAWGHAALSTSWSRQTPMRTQPT